MTTQQLAAQIKTRFDMDVDVRYLCVHDAKLSPDALYLVTESRKIRERERCTMVGAVHRVFGETLGTPWEYLHEAVRHMGG